MPKNIDISGQRFGRLRALHPIRHKETRRLLWECECSCGVRVRQTAGKLRFGHVTSCGCLVVDVARAKNPPPKDHVGERFARWTVLRLASVRGAHEARWECRCDCGAIGVVTWSNLKTGGSLSCGCWSSERARTQAVVNFAERLERNKYKLGEAAAKSLHNAYIRGAKKRNLSFNLTREQARSLFVANCHYCGVEPSRVHRGGRRMNGGFAYNGIDRVDNTRGYESDNCVTCCATCNAAKAAMTLAAFEGWIRRVYRRMASRKPLLEAMESSARAS